jgi:hypothetical protein
MRWSENARHNYSHYRATVAISDDFGDGTNDNDNLVFQYRTQLGLRTSFTGEDLLRMSIRSGNAGQFSYHFFAIAVRVRFLVSVVKTPSIG